MSHITIRPATAADVETILRFINGLAAFEKEPDAVKATPADLLRDGFGEHPKFEVLIAETDAEAVGFALFFPTYSTWEGRAGMHLEDIFVLEQWRGQNVNRCIGKDCSCTWLCPFRAVGARLESRAGILPSFGYNSSKRMVTVSDRWHRDSGVSSNRK